MLRTSGRASEFCTELVSFQTPLNETASKRELISGTEENLKAQEKMVTEELTRMTQLYNLCPEKFILWILT